jgi:hypothetical protein
MEKIRIRDIPPVLATLHDDKKLPSSCSKDYSWFPNFIVFIDVLSLLCDRAGVQVLRPGPRDLLGQDCGGV